MDELQPYQQGIARRLLSQHDARVLRGMSPLESIKNILARSIAAPGHSATFQPRVPFGTEMRRLDDAEDDGWQHGMALGSGAVLILPLGLPSYTSGWEIDPDADAPK